MRGWGAIQTLCACARKVTQRTVDACESVSPPLHFEAAMKQQWKRSAHSSCGLALGGIGAQN